MQKQLINRTVIFGENEFTFFLGGKKGDDFLIRKNGVQFYDLELFRLINDNVSDVNKFIKYFNNDICLFNDYIIINERNVDNIIDYINSLPENDTIKSIIFMIILRCEIDNINYPPCLNGCIRHFMQVFLILSFKFNLGFKIKSIDLNNNIDISKFVSDIGYPRNKYSVSKHDFSELYNNFKNNFLLKIGN